jgi:oligosaccharide repeat unit polymerase
MTIAKSIELTGKDTPLAGIKPKRHLSWLMSVGLAFVLTIIIGMLSIYNQQEIYAVDTIVLIMFANFIVLIHPIAVSIRIYRQQQDFFDPSLVATLAYILYYIVFNMVVLGNPALLIWRALLTEGVPFFLHTVYLSYAVIFVSWWAFYLGHTLLFKHKHHIPKANIKYSSTFLYLIIGVSFIAIGIIGNIGIIGGVGNYLSNMPQFFMRSAQYVENSIYGGTKWLIAMKFLPVGMILLFYGLALHEKWSRKLTVAALILASIANIFLNSATGQRSSTLMVFIYAIILINHSIRRLKWRELLIAGGIIVLIAVVLGALRNAAAFDIDPVTYLSGNFSQYFNTFTTGYLSNFLAILTLVSEFRKYGPYNQTLFSGFQGFFGGPHPVYTQDEIWYRLYGTYISPNPRMGAPGEFFFAYSWIGIIVGMFLMGALLKLLTNYYRNNIYKHTLNAGVIAIYTVFTTNFIVAARLSDIPKYFILYSVQFFFIFLVFRKIRC